MQRLAYGGELLMVVLRVDTDSFVDASAQAHSIAQSVSRALSRAVSGFGGLSQMAGSDPNGFKWAASYDQACGQLLNYAAQLQDAVSSVSRKLAVTGYYYEVVELANAGVTNVGLALPSPVVATSCPFIPSAAGGERRFPSPVPGMEWVAEQIANLVGNMWPDGDTAKLDEASRVWHGLADDLDDVASTVSKVPQTLSGVNTPELSRIEDEVHRVRTFAKQVASACRELASACNALSGKISYVHVQTEITVGVTIGVIAATVAAALGLTVFTFGISDAVGVAGVAGETAGAVATIGGFIAELGASISAAVGGIAASTAGLVGISADLAATIGVTVGDITASAVLWGVAGAGENVLVTGITEPDTGDLLGAAEEGFVGGAIGGGIGAGLGKVIELGGGGAAANTAAAGDALDSLSPEITHGVRFFGEEHVKYYTGPQATLGRPGDAIFLMPEQDAASVVDGIDAAIKSGLAPSVTNAARTGGDIYGVVVPLDGLPTRLPTVADANGWAHFSLGGRTGVNIDGIQLLNDTREFVVNGGFNLPSGTMVFKLLDGGAWEVVGMVG